MKKLYRFLLCISVASLVLACARQDEIDSLTEQGTFSLSLSADPTEIPTRADAKSLPEVKDFAVWVENTKGKELKRWDKYADMPSSVKFAVGTYVVKAAYGDSTACGFERPAFAGSKKITVARGDQLQVSLACGYSKTLVSVEPKEGFKNYYKDYTVEVATTTPAKPIVFVKSETRPAFLAKGKLTAKVKITRENDTHFEATMPAIDKTLSAEHYKLVLDVDKGIGGILFQVVETATNDVVLEKIVPLEAAAAGPPYFVTTGFDLSQPVITTPESYDKEVRLLIKARGYVKRCAVSVTSAHLISKGVPASFDLASTSLNVDLQNVLRGVGMQWSDNMQGSTLAEVNLSDVIKQLPAASNKPVEHVLRFTLEDSYGRLAEVLPLKIVVTQPVAEIKNITRVEESADRSNVEIDLTATLENGRYADLTGILYQKGFDWVSIPVGPNCVVTPSQQNPAEATIKIKGLPADQTQFPLRLVHVTPSPFNTQRISEPVTGYLNAPTFYTDLVNHTDTEAVLEVSSDQAFDASRLAMMVRNQGAWEADGTVTAYVTNGAGPYPFKATVKVTGLTPSEQYRMRGVVDARYNAITEAIFQTGGFQLDSWASSQHANVQKGGRLGWKKTEWKLGSGGKETSGYDTENVTVVVDEPSDGYWASVNRKTAAAGFSPWNSWYVVASTLMLTDGSSGNAARLRSVVWDNRGPAVPDAMPASFPSEPDWAWSDPNINRSTRAEVTPPDLSQCFRSAGRIFLGTYSCVHSSSGAAPSEGYAENGLRLRSKPVALTFKHRFKPYGSDMGQVKIVLYGENDNPVAVGQADIKAETTEWTAFSVPIVYTNQLKVVRMTIMFSSSKDETAIQYNGEDRTNCVATGNMLDIDEVSLVY